jgi:hypothetical protein
VSHAPGPRGPLLAAAAGRAQAAPSAREGAARGARRAAAGGPGTRAGRAACSGADPTARAWRPRQLSPLTGSNDHGAQCSSPHGGGGVHACRRWIAQCRGGTAAAAHGRAGGARGWAAEGAAGGGPHPQRPRTRQCRREACCECAQRGTTHAAPARGRPISAAAAGAGGRGARRAGAARGAARRAPHRAPPPPLGGRGAGPRGLNCNTRRDRRPPRPKPRLALDSGRDGGRSTRQRAGPRQGGAPDA